MGQEVARARLAVARLRNPGRAGTGRAERERLPEPRAFPVSYGAPLAPSQLHGLPRPFAFRP